MANPVDVGNYVSRAWPLFARHWAAYVMASVWALVLAMVSLGILAGPAIAAIQWAALQSIREARTPLGSDAFSALHTTLPLLGFFGLQALAISIGLGLFVIPGIVLALLFGAWWFYVPLLIVDRGLPLFEAMRVSKEKVRKAGLGQHILFSLIFYGAPNAAGTMIPIVGIFVALPLVCCAAAVAYVDLFDGTPEGVMHEFSHY